MSHGVFIPWTVLIVVSFFLCIHFHVWLAPLELCTIEVFIHMYLTVYTGRRFLHGLYHIEYTFVDLNNGDEPFFVPYKNILF